MPNKNWARANRLNSTSNVTNSSTPPASTLHGLRRFDAKEAEAWFKDTEQEFILCGIADSYIQAKHVLECLEQDELELMGPVLCELDDDDEYPYLKVKARLLEVFDNARWDRANLLLNHPPFSTGKPSDYMVNLLRLTPAGNTPHTLFMAIFISKMPPLLRDALSTESNDYATPDDLSDLADELWEGITYSAGHH